MKKELKMELKSVFFVLSVLVAVGSAQDKFEWANCGKYKKISQKKMTCQRKLYSE